ncbi:MAG: restriction endonuclease [Gammaproteobacteria bacterium]|nr:restriction endonuclease [Gammaproteobacteria bacterium]MYG97385.1 restriction endonuclease [Gammaproteobacteria bacterium]
MNQGTPLFHIDYENALQVFRDITNSTNERTVISGNVPFGPVGNNAPLLTYLQSKAVAYALVVSNMNSIPLDWSARMSIGGVHMSFFYVKQFPVLPPEAYLKVSNCGSQWVQLIVPRMLELTYTSEEMREFAEDLGYTGDPFDWDEQRRHYIQSELDAIFAHMYGLTRADLEWILDAEAPSVSFPSLKQNEIRRFGEYRTQRLVLHAFNLIAQGENPELTEI